MDESVCAVAAKTKWRLPQTSSIENGKDRRLMSSRPCHLGLAADREILRQRRRLGEHSPHVAIDSGKGHGVARGRRATHIADEDASYLSRIAPRQLAEHFGIVLAGITGEDETASRQLPQQRLDRAHLVTVGR